MSTEQAPRGRPFTGTHMAAILLSGFGVVLAVNIAMARLAASTFGGEVVDNSYVASQHFNRWLDEAAREKALGWKVAVSRRGDGRVAVRLAGVPTPAKVVAAARHPLGRKPDIEMAFRSDAGGTYVSDVVLPEGRWILRFDIAAAGRNWRGEDQVEGFEVVGRPVP